MQPMSSGVWLCKPKASTRIGRTETCGLDSHHRYDGRPHWQCGDHRREAMPLARYARFRSPASWEYVRRPRARERARRSQVVDGEDDQPSSMVPSISWVRSIVPTFSVIVAASFSLPCRRPAASASRTALSISRCDVTPTTLRNLRIV